MHRQRTEILKDDKKQFRLKNHHPEPFLQTHSEPKSSVFRFEGVWLSVTSPVPPVVSHYVLFSQPSLHSLVPS